MKELIQKAIEGGKRDYMRKPQVWEMAGFSWQCGLTSGDNWYLPQVDEVDVPLVSKYRWYYKDGYVVTSINGKRVKMHHLIIGKPTRGMVVDHINRDRMDNRRCNLRFVTVAQNGFNTTAKGVRQRGNSWEANVCVNYRKFFKGGFKTKEEALTWRNITKNTYAKPSWI